MDPRNCIIKPDPAEPDFPRVRSGSGVLKWILHTVFNITVRQKILNIKISLKKFIIAFVSCNNKHSVKTLLLLSFTLNNKGIRKFCLWLQFIKIAEFVDNMKFKGLLIVYFWPDITFFEKFVCFYHAKE